MSSRRLTILLPIICFLLLPAGAPAAPMSLQQSWSGEVVADQFGIAIAAVGDVNGDYFEDFLVGANVNDQLAQSGGRIYLYLGGVTYPTTPDLTFAGDVVRGYVGGAVAGGLDLNGDQYDDFVVGAPGLGPDDQAPGRAFVFYGGPTPDAVPDAILDGVVPAGQFGQAVALVPDWNGDGYADLAVGAPRAGNGTVSIFLGGPAGVSLSPDVVIHARPGDSRFGKSLASLADHNDDQRGELLVGVPRSFEAATWAGAVLLFEGAAIPDTTADLVLLGENAGDEFGTSLSADGDVDGDGLPDILVGAPFANPGLLVDAGRAYLFGTSGGLDAAPDLILAGSQTEERFGYDVTLGFDWDGDGQPDLAVGAPDRMSGGLALAGEVEIHFGGAVLDTVPDAFIAGDAAGLHLGTSVSAGGDLQGSGGTTLCTGGYNAVNAGEVWVHGRDEGHVVAVPLPQLSSARLAAPWPNPANPATSVALELQRGGHWRISVHDLRGNLVAVLHDGDLGAGQSVWQWRGNTRQGVPAASGKYLVRAVGEGGQLVQGLALIR